MSNTKSIQQLNRELADRLYEEAWRDPNSPHSAKKVGIANGAVVVVANDWNEVARKLRAAEPDPSRTFCFDAAVDYAEVQEIWEIA